MQLLLTRLGPPGQNKFRWLGWVAVLGLVLVALLVPASPALSNDTLGNNGTVKIHEDDTENDPGEVRNEPHVCTFHLHFYFSDPKQSGTWEIQEWSPGDKGTVVRDGTYDTHGDGEDRQPEEGVYTLDPGHYKLFWDGDLDTEKHDKMKVFWVDCETTTTTSSGTTTVAGSTTETTSGTTTSGTTTTVAGSTTESTSGTTTSGTTTTVAGSTTETTSGTTTSGTTTTSGETTVSGTTTGESTSSETTSGETTVSGTTTGATTVSGTTTGETTTGETTTGFTQTVSGTTTTSSEFSQTVSGVTTSAGPTLPNTATAGQGPTGGTGNAVSLLAAALAFLLGSVLVLSPAPAKKRD
jgi:hypothetical protein